MVDSTGKYVTMTARRIEVRRNQKGLFKKDLLIYQGKFNNNQSSNFS